MSENVAFLFSMLISGGMMFGAGGLAGVRVRIRHPKWAPAERDSVRIALEFALFTMVFALLPLLLAYMLVDETALWVIGSVLMAVFLAAQLARIVNKSREYGMRWPVVTTSLLVLSVVLLTIELLNILWWQGLTAYAAGLIWLFFLAGIQTIAFVCYDRIPTLDNDIHPTNLYNPGFHGAMGQRVRRDNHPGHSHRPPDSSANRYRDPVQYARSQRHLNRSRTRR